MNERAFVNFFSLLGIGLLLIGNVAFLEVDTQLKKILARDMLPFVMCQKGGEGYILVEASPDTVCPYVQGFGPQLRGTDCAAIEEASRPACEKLKAILADLMTGCSRQPYVDYKSPNKDELQALCGVFEL